MAAIKIENFKGMIPRTHPTALPDGCAVDAYNCRIKNTKLAPLKVPVAVSGNTIRLENGCASVSVAKTVYPWRRKVASSGSTQEVMEFLAWPGIVDVCRGNVADDDYDRIIVSGETGIPFVSGQNSNNEPAVYFSNKTLAYDAEHSITRRSLVKSAPPAPKVRLGEGGASGSIKKYTYFFQTWVDKYGYESPVSDKSLVYAKANLTYVDGDLEYCNGDLVNIAEVPANDRPDNGQATIRRIYKVNSGTASEQIQFVTEFSGPLMWNAHDIEIRDEDLGETLEPVTAPPTDLRNIVAMPGQNGFYAGISKQYPKTVLFSEIGEPYNWPIAYRYDVADHLVAIVCTSNTLFALTDGYPYVFAGTAPESMTSAVLANSFPCISKQSVCVYKNSVYYASHQGIAMIYNDANEGTTVTNLTDKFFTKEQWNALNPASCRMVAHDSALHAFFKIDSSYKSYIFDMTEQECMMTMHGEFAECACTEDESGDLFYVKKEVQ